MSRAREWIARSTSRIVVEFRRGVRFDGESVASSAETREVWDLFEASGARCRRFVQSVSPSVLQRLQSRSQFGPLPPICDLGQFWSVEFDSRRVSLNGFVDALSGISVVAGLHLEEGSSYPSERSLFPRAPSCSVRDLGIEVFRKYRGGLGEFASLADVEGGWEVRSPWYRIDHPRPIWGSARFQSDRLHGEKTLSVLLSSGNERYPEMGITPGLSRSILLSSYVTSPTRCDTANAILAATARLVERPGSILLLEVTRGACHRRSPAVSLPTELFPPDFHAIRLAVSLGITVVEAAGNGANGKGLLLDDLRGSVCGLVSIPQPANGAPPSLHEAAFDSGAILVAAVDPGVSGEERSVRLTSESNWGERITCASIGRGLAVLKRNSNVELGVYGGTSAASAIISGLLAAVQSIRLQQRRSPVSPSVFRSQLREISATKNPSEFRIPTASDFIDRFVNN